VQLCGNCVEGDDPPQMTAGALTQFQRIAGNMDRIWLTKNLDYLAGKNKKML
jgi:hypothetical protein